MDVSPRLKAGIQAFGALTGAELLMYAANAAFGFASGLDGFFEDYVYTGLIVAAGAVCLARGFAVPEERAAWLTMGGIPRLRSGHRPLLAHGSQGCAAGTARCLPADPKAAQRAPPAACRTTRA